MLTQTSTTRPSGHHREMISAMSAAEWDPLYVELVKYAMSLTRNNYWMGVWNGRLPRSKDAHDLVMECIEDVLDGTRAGDADPGVPLVAILKMVIKSKVSHLIKGLDNQRTLDVEQREENQDESPEDAISDTSAHPDEVAARNEAEAQNDKLMSLLMDEVSDDPALMEILGCILEDEHLPRVEMAKKLGMTPDELTNHGKRMDRRLLEFRKKHAGEFPFLKIRK